MPDIPASKEEIMDRNSDIVPTDVARMYVYPVPSSLNCTGTAIAVEFCYNANATTSNRRPIFDLLPLKQKGTNFTVTGTRLTIESQPTDQICIDQQDDVRCCDRMNLNQDHELQLPGDNFAFSILTPMKPRYDLLAFFASLQEYQVDVFAPGVNDVVTENLQIRDSFDLPNSKDTATLKIIRFIITGKFVYNLLYAILGLGVGSKLSFCEFVIINGVESMIIVCILIYIHYRSSTSYF